MDSANTNRNPRFAADPLRRLTSHGDWPEDSPLNQALYLLEESER